MDLGAEPVQVEDHGIQRDVLAAKPAHDVAHFLLGAVAEARCEVAERPARRERLPSRYVGVIADEFRVIAAGNHQVGRSSGNGLEVEQIETFGLDYARTLATWRDRFVAAWPELEESHALDERFRRMWDLYLTLCEAGFRVGRINVEQWVFART